MADTTVDLRAIADYFDRTEAVTPQAIVLKDKWTIWWDNQSWFNKNVTPLDIYDEARNRRNAFNLANATTAEERAIADRVAKKGYTTEEMRGESKRILSTGRFPEESKPWIPTWAKVTAVAAGAVTVVAIGARKLHII